MGGRFHRGARGWALPALLCLASAVMGCGEDGTGGTGSVARLEEGRLLRILDPSGRLYMHPRGLNVYAVGDDGGLSRVGGISDFARLPQIDVERVPAGDEIVIFAHGCRVERAHAPAAGEQIVRLRRGLPVRLRVRWDGTLPEGWTQLGIGLASIPVAGSPAERAGVRLHAIGADWMDRDLPAKPDWTPIRGADSEVLLYVPEPGDYEVQWKLDAPNRGSGYHDPKPVTIPAGRGGEFVELVAPSAWMEAQARPAGPRSAR